ncbi:MAG: rod shape-determining protein MreC [Campylobacterota bacterium]|nr:rod shape-determining protein MreC [Campylobacterota bacterium]
MNKKVLLALFLLFYIGYYFRFDEYIQYKIFQITKNISSFTINSIDFIKNNINNYFQKVSYIEDLKEQNNLNNQYKIKYNILKNKLEEYNSSLLSYDSNLSLKKVFILSYKNFNDYSKAVLNYDISDNKIYALLTNNGFSAGIVIKEDKQTIVYFNNNSKANYTVFIGKNNIPGITSGINFDGKLIIKYIPLWKNVNIGDKIVTSGLDNIFPLGIKVGSVVSIYKNNMMQEIICEPYNSSIKQRYFYLYDSNKSF